VKQELLRKSVIFYAAISAKEINKNLDIKAIDYITKYKIRTDLVPVIAKRIHLILDCAQNIVKKYISELIEINYTSGTESFWTDFENKEYMPELLFEDEEILEEIRMAPKALWKIRE
jgi:hypothetical protein